MNHTSKKNVSAYTMMLAALAITLHGGYRPHRERSFAAGVERMATAKAKRARKRTARIAREST